MLVDLHSDGRKGTEGLTTATLERLYVVVWAQRSAQRKSAGRLLYKLEWNRWSKKLNKLLVRKKYGGGGCLEIGPPLFHVNSLVKRILGLFQFFWGLGKHLPPRTCPHSGREWKKKGRPRGEIWGGLTLSLYLYDLSRAGSVGGVEFVLYCFWKVLQMCPSFNKAIATCLKSKLPHCWQPLKQQVSQ